MPKGDTCERILWQVNVDGVLEIWYNLVNKEIMEFALLQKEKINKYIATLRNKYCFTVRQLETFDGYIKGYNK